MKSVFHYTTLLNINGTWLLYKVNSVRIVVKRQFTLKPFIFKVEPFSPKIK